MLLVHCVTSIKIHWFFQTSTKHDVFQAFRHSHGAYQLIATATPWHNRKWQLTEKYFFNSILPSRSPQFNNWALSILVCHAKNMYSIYCRFGHTSSNHYHSSRSDELFILCFDQNHDKSNSKYLQSCLYNDFMYSNCKLQIYTVSTWAFMALFSRTETR